MRTLFIILLIALCGVAHAAKVPISWVNASENTDGSPLTNLDKVRIEWGSCNGSEFGTLQASILFETKTPGIVRKGFIYPTGLATVCIRAYSLNTEGVISAPTATVVAGTLPATGKPRTLDQPVIF